MPNNRKEFKNTHLPTKSNDIARWDLLVAGELNLDIILNQVNRMPELEKEVTSEGLNLTIGSSSCIMALNAAALGVTTRFAGCVGNDAFADQCLGALNERSIDTRYVKLLPYTQTGLTCIFTMAKKRGMITFPGAMEEFGVEDIPDELLHSVKHLHVSSYYLQKKLRLGLPSLFKKAKDFGLTTSLDTNYDPDEVWGDEVLDVLQNTDIFFPNDNEAMAISKTSAIEDALDVLSRYVRLVLVTCGSAGVKGRSADVMYSVAGIKLKSVDAIGAGDTFNSGFLSSFLRGETIEKCIISGVHASAFSTLYTGGTTAFNHLGEFKTFCDSNPIEVKTSSILTVS